MTNSGQENPTSNQEKVLSGLEVEAVLRLGSEHLFLLFTQTRLILAHQEKIGRSAVPIYGMLGKMSEGLGRSRVKTGSLQKMADTDPEAILLLRPENFAVEYPRIVSMRIESDQGSKAKIILVTADQKIELRASTHAAEGVREFVQSVLAGRVEYRR